MPNKRAKELNDAMSKLWHDRVSGKISEAKLRRDALALLEANTVNTTAETRKAINELVAAANATRNVKDSLKKMSGVRKLRF